MSYSSDIFMVNQQSSCVTTATSLSQFCCFYVFSTFKLPIIFSRSAGHLAENHHLTGNNSSILPSVCELFMENAFIPS